MARVCRTHIGFWWKARRKDHYEDSDIGERIILKCILEIG
jgi:hypothetical protein